MGHQDHSQSGVPTQTTTKAAQGGFSTEEKTGGKPQASEALKERAETSG